MARPKKTEPAATTQTPAATTITGTRPNYSPEKRAELLNIWDTAEGKQEEKFKLIQAAGYNSSIGGFRQNVNNWRKASGTGTPRKTRATKQPVDDTAWIDAIPELFRASALAGMVEAISKKHGHKFKAENLKRAIKLDALIQGLQTEITTAQTELKTL